ncbi:Putative oxidoreductase MhqP (plasmid) [Streptomyces sp. YIM 121038]|uniref:ABC transporter permease subunit n=1 Tax=Streptomyces sp. YIM 121038 TaxID=2136401 RepID=UPI00110FFE59|nr:ABC transporter permease subunit [Streptomyces sp. YIM 121038]QCX82755.1 Putative oxidoreductase MhqP [Streptomyces sp. YIM 121038]
MEASYAIDVPAAVDAGLCALRLAVAVIITYHGTEKLFGWWGAEGLDGTAAFFARVGYRPPRVMAAVAGLTETAGGVLLALGALTPLATAALIGTFVNILLLHVRNGLSRKRNGFEYELVLLACACCVALAGPGTWSLDELAGVRDDFGPWGWVSVAAGALAGAAVSASRARGGGGDDAGRASAGTPAQGPGPATAHPAAGRGKAVRRRLAPLGRGLVGAAVLALAFEGFARLGLVDRQLLPPSSVILPETARLLVDPEFLGEAGHTLRAVVTGTGLACAVAVPAGLLLGSYAPLTKALTPIVESLRSVPGIAIIPLLVLVLGQGLRMEVTLVAFVTTWPLLFNTMYGVRGADRVAVETARSFRVGTLATWWRVVLPGALPLILTGLRVALSTALTVAVAAEIAVGTQQGIGHVILAASYAGFHADEVFAAVTVAGLIGFLLNFLTSVVARRVTRWDTREAS